MQELVIVVGEDTYRVLVDYSPVIPTDPVIFVSRNEEPDPLAAIHLNAGNGSHCNQPNHITVGR